MANQTIENYLLDNNLKPLFIFSMNGQSIRYGVFVGSKGKRENGDNDFATGDLSWNLVAGLKPAWKIDLPLWILPLEEKKDDEGKFSLKYGSVATLPLAIDHCELKIVDNKPAFPVGTGSWEDYKNLGYNEEDPALSFSHTLSFESDQFSLIKEQPFTIKETNGESSRTLHGWFFGDNNIAITDRLLKFDGVQCEIVDQNGKKNEFHIWCGVRRAKKEVHFSINNSAVQDANPGADCPIIWQSKGLLDDTVLPDNDSNTLGLQNKNFKLRCRAAAADDDLSRNISIIVEPKILRYDIVYSWFLKEGARLSPIFVNLKKIGDSPFFRKGINPTNTGHKEIKLFGINRFNEVKRTDTSIFIWIVGYVRNAALLELMKTMVNSSHVVNKSGPQTITPIFDDKFSTEDQVVLEFKINKGNVAFETLRLFNLTSNALRSNISDNQNLYLPNLRLSNYERNLSVLNDNNKYNKIYDLKKIFKLETLNFDADNISKKSDNGTVYAFNISNPKKNNDLGQELYFNDGSFSFQLDQSGFIYGKVYFSLQLQKAQKPLFLWEWHKKLELADTIVPCFSVEEFKLPVKNPEPFSTDVTFQDRYIAGDDNSSLGTSGNLKAEQSLIIPLNAGASGQKYHLSFSESINVGQDYNSSIELILNNFNPDNPRDISVASHLKLVVISTEPQTVVKVKTPFGTNPLEDGGKWVVARKNNLSIDGGVWEILNGNGNDEGITLTFPPQIIGEAFRKTNDGPVIIGEPEDNELVETKFGPPSVLHITNEQLDRQMVSAPWNLRNLFANYGDSNPGLRLLHAQFELLYGLSAYFENPDAYVAELENKLGQMVKAPRGRIAWAATESQSEAFKTAFSDYVQILKLWISRLAIYEVSANQDKFLPAKFNQGIDYFFRVAYVDDQKNGAKLKWPFKAAAPDYLKEISDKYHDKDGLAGGFHFGFESFAVYKELFEGGLKNGSSSGEIENLAFSSMGGYGKQVARFNNDKTIIKSTTTLGRTHFYAVERIGRIGVLWNRAKHVIEYERTVVPSFQFQGTQNKGRLVVRKVREFVEILEPERSYPEFGAENFSAGSIQGSHFKSIKIPVSSSWGRDIVHDGEPVGWEVPLWNEKADQLIYPFPQIMLRVMASKESDLKSVLNNLVKPQKLYFYTDTRERVQDMLVTSATNNWSSVVGVDYTLQPFKNVYLEAQPCFDYDDPKLVNVPLSSPIHVLPGFERFTFEILPSDVPVSANGAYNNDSNIVGRLRTVTMQRRPVIVPEIVLDLDKGIFVEKSGEFLLDKLNGYSDAITTILNAEDEVPVEKVLDRVKADVAKHLAAINQNSDLLGKIVSHFRNEPAFSYFTKYDSTRLLLNEVHILVQENWEPTTLFLWFSLIKELDSSISAVDKHYTLLFNNFRTELFQIIDNVDITAAGIFINTKIDRFEEEIIHLNEMVECNIGPFKQSVKNESDKLKEGLESVFGQINKALSGFFDQAEAALNSIPDDATIIDFKKEIQQKVNDAINEVIKSALKDAVISKDIHDQIEDRLVDYSTKLKKSVQDVVDLLPDNPFELDLAKTQITEVLNYYRDEATNTLSVLKEALTEYIDNANAFVVSFINDLELKLNDLQNLLNEKIRKARKAVSDLIADGNESKQLIKQVLEDNLFSQKDGWIMELTISILDLLVRGYDQDNTSDVPPLAHIFNKLDIWTKDLIKDFNSLLAKIKQRVDNAGEAIQDAVNHYLPHAIGLYEDYRALEGAIKDGNKDELIKYVNQLSQSVNEDFGQVIGNVTANYYDVNNLALQVGDLKNEFQNALFNYRSVMEDIKAVDLGFNRQSVELIYNFEEKYAPQLLLTPIMGKLRRVSDGLDAMGISIPYAGLEDKFVAPMKEWGSKFAKSLSGKFPFTNLLSDISGFKFTDLLPFLKSDDTFFKAVNISQGIDEKAFKAWVRADFHYTFASDNTLMSIGPVQVRILQNATIVANAYGSSDIDNHKESKNKGTLKATFEISLSGVPLMLFKDTLVYFEDGKYDFKLDPSRMEMPGFLKVITDASKQISPPVPAGTGGKGGSPFKIEMLKYGKDIGGEKYEIPIGMRANLDLPPINVGGGTTSITNLAFGGNFLLQAIDTSQDKLELDFLIGLGFYLGKRSMPFNITAFILGGGGYIDCSFKYKPSVSTTPFVDFVMSVHASAGFAIGGGWITGNVLIFAGIEVEYNSMVRSTRIEIFLAIIGDANLLGMVTVHLELRLAINYLSNDNGTVLYGVGFVSVEIKVCAFVTINVKKNYTMILKGESKQVTNKRSETIAASLN